MSHTKAGGSTRLGRDSQGQRLGTKLYGGEFASTGNIIVRQRGSKIRAGKNVRMGSDDTLYAVADGLISFTRRRVTTFAGKFKTATFVNVMPKVAKA